MKAKPTNTPSDKANESEKASKPPSKQPSKLKRFVWLVLSLFLLALVAMLGVIGYGYHLIQQPISQQAHAKIIDLPSGVSARRMTQQLHQAGLLERPREFEWYLRYHELAHQLRPGELEIDPQWTFEQLAQALIHAPRVRYPFVIIPGETLAQVKEKLDSLPKLNRVLDNQAWLDLAIESGVTNNLEGWLLPETYYYHKGETDKMLVARAVQAMKMFVEVEWRARAQNLPIKTPYEALILASIIEKETGAAHERQKIAGVFVNRLNKRMRLQTDPTVIYGMGDLYQGRIGRAGLDRWTPYNTYRNHGLTPTPIAMPSREAVLAALNPETTDALYFVSKGNGEHHFSATLDEHNRAVRRYILNRR
jgi:UPF0755 protein